MFKTSMNLLLICAHQLIEKIYLLRQNLFRKDLFELYNSLGF